MGKKFFSFLGKKELDKPDSLSRIIELVKTSSGPETIEQAVKQAGLERCECDTHESPCPGPAAFCIERKGKKIKICIKCSDKDDKLLNCLQYDKIEQYEVAIAWNIIGTPNMNIFLREQLSI